MTEPVHSKSNYRPDIDGLRAVAVLAVVGFHSEIGALRGGFIGVDVFFVISGYLISGIIFNSLAHGTFAFTEFYTRRVNRIFPALLTVLAATILIGWGILFPAEFKSLGKHILAGAGFASNFVLWSESGYFASPQKPLLHLWSLAVEEQFYLFFPAVAFIAYKCKWKLDRILVGIVTASFFLNVWTVSHGQGVGAFFAPWTRFWEIISGAILCRYELTRPLAQVVRTNQRLREIGALVGIAALLGAFELIDESMQWPGLWALLPVVATLLLIGSGPNAWVNRTIMSQRLLVAVGLISYPLYLWHWPLIVFGRILYQEQVPRAGRMLIIGISFVLATATYFLIERPIRFGARKRRSAGILLVSILVAGGTGALLMSGLPHPRLAGSYATRVEAATTDEPDLGAHFNKLGDDIIVRSISGDSTAEVDILGDSHAEQYGPRFEKLRALGGKKFPRVTFLTYGGCPPLPHVGRSGVSWDGAKWRCDKFYQIAMRRALNPNVKTIVVSAYWEKYLLKDTSYFSTLDPRRDSLRLKNAGTESVLSDFERDVLNLSRQGKRVFIILSNPSAPAYDPVQLLPARLPGLQNKKAVTLLKKEDIIGPSAGIRRRLTQIAARTSATIIDPTNYLCGATTCSTIEADGRPIYRDWNHLRASYVRDHADFLDIVTEWTYSR